MAWDASGMALNGSPGGEPMSSNAGLANSGASQGTDYTLQGVMRFLQIEWHRHERERNAWQIERAEFRARIAKLEGDLRTNKKLRESMDKHVRMLENVIKKGKREDQDGDGPGSPQRRPNTQAHNSFLHVDSDDAMRHDTDRERSRKYLGNCLEEFTYYLHKAPAARAVPVTKSEPVPLLSDVYAQPEPESQPLPEVKRESYTPATTTPIALADRTRPQSDEHTQRMARFPDAEDWDAPSLADANSTTYDEAQFFQFNVRFALRGHLDVVRTVIFTGEGSPAGPELCTAGDDGVIKRWTAAGSRLHSLDLKADETHRGHIGAVLCLATLPLLSDGRVFSGGQDATIRLWERGRVEAIAHLDGHTDAVWALCVLPGNVIDPLKADQMAILVSGSADGTVLVWTFSTGPRTATTSRRAKGTSRRANSISSGSDLSGVISNDFAHNLVHRIGPRANAPPVTSISALSLDGSTFAVSYGDASVIVYDIQSGEELASMASQETYDGSNKTGVNVVVARGGEGEVISSGHEDHFVRFYDAKSGQCTYTMLAHPAPISSLCLSPSGTEMVSSGHDASLRFWNLETRSCVQEISAHRNMRGEGVCSVAWSVDGQWIASGGGDGVVKVFARTVDELKPIFDGDLANGIDMGESTEEADDDGWRF